MVKALEERIKNERQERIRILGENYEEKEGKKKVGE